MKKPLLSLLKERFPEYKEGELYAFVLCGDVYCDGEKIRETSRKVDVKGELEIRTKKYVSRGGFKLEGALDEWGIDCNKKIFIDAGSSTGGFTDCLLQRGASLVYAVDVGYNQLDYSLRNNSRVVVREKCNIMDVEELDPAPHIGVADLSFRSIGGAATKIIGLTTTRKLLALIKPQFEVENSAGFNGVISDPETWRRVLFDVCECLHGEGLYVSRLSPSKVKGKKGGNQEFMALIVPRERDSDFESFHSYYSELIGQCLGKVVG
ncbi:MAG: TlyA family RNA methyltransferase [Spirochaetales bacterium]|nr:TlyA family RNA methyltransferase [Spirochaetales bacterium]